MKPVLALFDFDGTITRKDTFLAFLRFYRGNVQLRHQFPTDFYEEENAECKQYLPEVVSVNAQALVDLACAKRTLEIERFIAQCVVLGLPERYP